MAPLPIKTSVTPLRQRMQQDMQMRGLGRHTQHDYIGHVRGFAAFLGRAPDTATAEDIRRFQLHQHETGVSASTINSAVSALRVLFTVTLGRRDLSRALVITRNPRKLPEVLSVEEAARLLAEAPDPEGVALELPVNPRLPCSCWGGRMFVIETALVSAPRAAGYRHAAPGDHPMTRHGLSPPLPAAPALRAMDCFVPIVTIAQPTSLIAHWPDRRSAPIPLCRPALASARLHPVARGFLHWGLSYACHRLDRIPSTRRLRISAANIGPNLFHQNRTVS